MKDFQVNFPMALDEPTHRLFVGCRHPARLVVFDTTNGKRVSDLLISGDTDDLFATQSLSASIFRVGKGMSTSLTNKMQTITEGKKAFRPE